MTSPGRPTVITGNWKMYKTSAETKEYIKQLKPLVTHAIAKVYLAVPFTSIATATKEASGSAIVIGAQNMHDATEGAFTGEIAAKMLIEHGAKFVILGHSERRIHFGESNDFINRKVKRAIEENLQPILCVGEPHEQREAGTMQSYIENQLKECLAGIAESQLSQLIIAYEPIWAVGTDNAATPEAAEEMHTFIRQWIGNAFSEQLAQAVVIQYGGSVIPENAKALLDMPNIDGLLIGGASLSAEAFSKIVNIEIGEQV